MTLADLLQNPDQLRDVPRESIPPLIIALAARLLSTADHGGDGRLHGDEAPDKLVTVKEAAALLSVDPKWIYRRKKRLPFIRQLSPKVLRVSMKRFRRWQEARKDVLTL